MTRNPAPLSRLLMESAMDHARKLARTTRREAYGIPVDVTDAAMNTAHNIVTGDTESLTIALAALLMDDGRAMETLVADAAAGLMEDA